MSIFSYLPQANFYPAGHSSCPNIKCPNFQSLLVFIFLFLHVFPFKLEADPISGYDSRMLTWQRSPGCYLTGVQQVNKWPLRQVYVLPILKALGFTPETAFALLHPAREPGRWGALWISQSRACCLILHIRMRGLN